MFPKGGPRAQGTSARTSLVLLPRRQLTKGWPSLGRLVVVFSPKFSSFVVPRVKGYGDKVESYHDELVFR